MQLIDHYNSAVYFQKDCVAQASTWIRWLPWLFEKLAKEPKSCDGGTACGIMHVVPAGMDPLASHSQLPLTLALRATAQPSLALCLTSPMASCLTGTTVVRPSEVSLTCCPSW